MAHPDLDQLLNALLPFAKQMLEKHGEFYPFSATMQRDGAIRLVNGVIGDSEHPRPTEIIAFLEAAFKKQPEQGEIKAAGICYDVRVIPPGKQDKTDAILASLEHIEGQAVSVYLPYKKGLFKKVTYGDLFATSAQHKIFTNVQR